jgi:hypothetical protein
MKIIETDRLILCRLTTDDAAFILRLVNDAKFLQYIGDREVKTLDDARKYILNSRKNWSHLPGNGQIVS